MDAAPRTPAIAFLALLAPYGIVAGYVTITLAWQLQAAGLTAGVIAALVALSVWPNIWKVLWAPLIDTTLGLKRWYVVGTLLTAASLAGLGCVHPTLSNFKWLASLIVIATVASTLPAMASEAMMAHVIEDGRRGSAAGWGQAANLGGAGLGGGLALYLSQHLSQNWMAGAGTALLCVAAMGALPLVHLDVRSERRLRLLTNVRGIVREAASLLRSRRSLLVVLLMLLPIGSGGAQNLWSAIAVDWHAGADLVALVNGVLSGLASLVGAIVGGWLCDRMDRRLAYCLFGLMLAAVACSMAWLPRSPAVFAALVLMYELVVGACYAAFSAVVLEAIGREAAATKYQLLSSVSNVPIALVTTWDGRLHDWRGASAMLIGEATFCLAAVALFAIMIACSRRIPTRTLTTATLET